MKRFIVPIVALVALAGIITAVISIFASGKKEIEIN